MTSAQQQQQPASPAQPSHWKPSQLSQLIGQLSQLDAKASQVRGNLQLLCLFFLSQNAGAGATVKVKVNSEHPKTLKGRTSSKARNSGR
ncbi:hypothetical protein LA080_012381 [Diaporthe eres]|nr:hypothetical protein LA080_012381 [Diaporthe eres]